MNHNSLNEAPFDEHISRRNCKAILIIVRGNLADFGGYICRVNYWQWDSYVAGICIFVDSAKLPLEKIFQFMLLPTVYKKCIRIIRLIPANPSYLKFFALEVKHCYFDLHFL